MILEELKAIIEERTGVQADLLEGDTPEEIIERARTILDIREKREEERPKNTREKFAEWLGSNYENNYSMQPKEDPLVEIAETMRIEAGGYPRVKDGGTIEADRMGDLRSSHEKFAEWFYHASAFDPRKR